MSDRLPLKVHYSFTQIKCIQPVTHHAQLITNLYLCSHEKVGLLISRFLGGRKVRTPESSKADNIRHPRG